MNTIYARNVLNRVLDGVHKYTYDEDKEAIHAMSRELQQIYELGQANPHTELERKVKETLTRGTRIEEIHVVGEYVIVETVDTVGKEVANLFGVWNPLARDGKGRIEFYHYSLEEALLAAIALKQGKDDKDWMQANQEAHYAGMILGLEVEK